MGKHCVPLSTVIYKIKLFLIKPLLPESTIIKKKKFPNKRSVMFCATDVGMLELYHNN